MTGLHVRGLAAQLDLVRTKAEVQKRRAAADTLRLAIGRLEAEQQPGSATAWRASSG
jgi:hypothetical protein